jgi:aconitase A
VLDLQGARFDKLNANGLIQRCPRACCERDGANLPQHPALAGVHAHRARIGADGSRQVVTVTLRIDTPVEVDDYRSGGILPCVLQQLLA